MRHELLRPVGRDQRRDRDKTAVAFGESLALPQVAVNNIVGVIDQCGRECLDTVAFGGRRCLGRFLGHASLPCSFEALLKPFLKAARQSAAIFVAIAARTKISISSSTA